MNEIEMLMRFGLGSKPLFKRVGHSRMNGKLTIRVNDETYYKILEIREKIPTFKYSSYLRPIIEDAIDRLHKAVMKADSKLLEAVE